MPLLERDDSLLVVIDLQPQFWGDSLGAEDRRCAETAAARAAWLAAAATAWGIPAVVTEEAPDRKGPTDEAVLRGLRAGTPVFTKPVFGVTGCPDIMAAIRATGRRTALLAGYETDVCITHSAVGLGEAGYRAVVAEDAVYSPCGAHRPGQDPGSRGRIRGGQPAACLAARILAVSGGALRGDAAPDPGRAAPRRSGGGGHLQRRSFMPSWEATNPSLA